MERSANDESARSNYEFANRAVDFTCDQHDEIVRTIFLHAEAYDATLLSEVPFHLRRDEELAHFGNPSWSRAAISHPVLGDVGPADQFRLATYTLHIEYKVDAESIKMITLMRNDVVPGG